MPRTTKGPTVQVRVKRLFEALLDFANWEFDECDSKIQVNWQAEDSVNPKLIVRTTLADLHWLTKKDNYPGELTKPQIREALNRLKDFLKILEDNRTQTQGVDTWHFTLTLWSKDKEKNLQQFDLLWKNSRSDNSKKLEAAFKKAPLTPQFWGEQDQTTSVLPPKVGGAGGGIDWHDVCRAMLEKQKRLTTNELLSADEDMKFELDDIHVPLALVQRTKPDKRSGDVSPEEGSRLLQPTYEKKQQFRHEEFLAQVLQEGKGQSKGRRIAVIGEPGAGKTTLLQSLAFWILDKNLGLPIWISLADLQGKTVEEYLLQRWLKNALEVARVTPEQENVLLELFKKERVWLLLDGVDEIAGGSVGVGAQGIAPLQVVAFQLEGWVAKARVVLSCRLNVWEANINALGDDFETYRLLDFDYPLQVKEFICRWFRKTDADKGEGLWAELDKSERQRIQDLVKNPLRLALLCSTLQSSDKGLPSTKAGLYERFVEVFYTWKKNRFPTTFEQRQKLNAGLGRLALRAIDSEVSRFRLRHKVVCEVLGDPEREGSLFGLALQLGWLNQVGLAAESETQEKVYAFYHPTFQEYFAAKRLVDCDDRRSLVSDFADLPQSLQSVITNDSQLSQTIHLICIDGSQFIEPDRPATEIYDQMLDQNCPECDSVPETMPALKLYWNSLKRNSDKRVVLVFYASSTNATLDEGTTLLCPYSSAFLTDLSKFGREICVITEQPFNHIPLKFFAPIQPIADIVQWIRAIVREN